MKKLTSIKEKIIKLYLLGKYNTKLDISKTLKVNQGYVVQVIKEFDKNTIISNDFGICQSLYNSDKFYCSHQMVWKKYYFCLMVNFIIM